MDLGFGWACGMIVDSSCDLCALEGEGMYNQAETSLHKPPCNKKDK